MDLLSKGIGLGLEPLSCNEAVPIDYEQTLFQVLVNEGKHIRVSLHNLDKRLLSHEYNSCSIISHPLRFNIQILNAKRPQFSYNGKLSISLSCFKAASHLYH